MGKMRQQKFIEAKIEYSPRRMLEHLARDANGVVYFDRTRCVHDEIDSDKFCYVLNLYYRAGYKDIDDLTVYFEESNNEILAGAYSLSRNAKLSKYRIISTNEDMTKSRTPYTYSIDEIQEFASIIAGG